MKIIVNSIAHNVMESNIHTILIELNYGKARVATALNGEFVTQEMRINTLLNEGDRLEILAPMQGG